MPLPSRCQPWQGYSQRRNSARELDALCQGGVIAAKALTMVIQALLAGETDAEAAALGAAEIMLFAGAGFEQNTIVKETGAELPTTTPMLW